MEDSDSFSAKTSDNGDDDNKEDDGVTSVEHCHFFEGVEKLLEVWFTSSSGMICSTYGFIAMYIIINISDLKVVGVQSFKSQ